MERHRSEKRRPEKAQPRNFSELVRLGLVLSTLMALLACEKLGQDREEQVRQLAQLQRRLELSVGSALKWLEGAPRALGQTAQQVEAELTRIISQVQVTLEDLIHSRYFGTVKLKEGERLRFEKVLELFQYSDAQVKKLPKYTAIPTTEQMEKGLRNLYAWTIANGFGLQDAKYAPVSWSWFPWDQHLGSYARTNCLAGTIEVNNNFDPRIPGIQFPLSEENSWPYVLSDLAHEDIHLYGKVCRIYVFSPDSFGTSPGSNGVEATAQAGALEVLASRANHGDMDALYAFVLLRREIALRAVIYSAFREGREKEAMAALMKAADNPFDAGRIERLFGAAENDFMIRFILREDTEQYGYSPLEAIIDAGFNPQHETKKLLKFNETDEILTYDRHILDDTWFFIEHEDSYLLFVIAEVK